MWESCNLEAGYNVIQHTNQNIVCCIVKYDLKTARYVLPFDQDRTL